MANQVSLVDDIVSEYQGIEMQMGDPEVAGDQTMFRKLSKRYAELRPIVAVNNELEQARQDLEDAKEMAYEDHDFQDEVDRLEPLVVELEESSLTYSLRVTSTTPKTSLWRSRLAPAARRPHCSQAISRECTSVMPTKLVSSGRSWASTSPTWAA